MRGRKGVLRAISIGGDAGWKGEGRAGAGGKETPGIGKEADTQHGHIPLHSIQYNLSLSSAVLPERPAPHVSCAAWAREAAWIRCCSYSLACIHRKIYTCGQYRTVGKRSGWEQGCLETGIRPAQLSELAFFMAAYFDNGISPYQKIGSHLMYPRWFDLTPAFFKYPLTP